MAQKLQEQLGYGQRVSDQRGVVVQRRRASAPQMPVPASRHYAGHYAGNHPEDTPYITQDRPRRTIQPQEDGRGGRRGYLPAATAKQRQTVYPETD